MEVILIIGLIILNGLLSMAEIALVSARKARLETMVKKGKKTALKALELSKEPNKFLSAIQTGITLIGILTGLFSGEAFAANLAQILSQIPVIEPYSLAVSKLMIVIAVTYLTIVIGELVPKRIGMSFAESTAIFFAKPLTWFATITAPFVWILSKSTQGVVAMFGLNNASANNRVTEEEIKAVVHEGFEGGEVEEVEQDIVERVFHLGDRTVGSIMTHRSEIVWIDTADTAAEIRNKVKTKLFNTYPVVTGKFDNIQGVVFLKELFGYIDDDDFLLSKIIRQAHFIQENMSVYNALEQFRQAKVKYGIVTDEFGSIQGIVTLKDIVDALIGEINEHDEKPNIVKRRDGSVLVDGQCSFYSFLEYFDMEYLYEENDYNTLSGLILDILERVPKTGNTFQWKDFDFEIVDMDGARIDKVLVSRRVVSG
ncbi:MAG: hemolysin family protein [Tannerella sp.]|jgi:putative hemolysin|nr:hemolysin family protein [Tannerella sp.]